LAAACRQLDSVLRSIARVKKDEDWTLRKARGKNNKNKRENKPKRMACGGSDSGDGEGETRKQAGPSLSSPFRAGHQLIIGANQSILYVSSSLHQRWLQSNRIEIDSLKREKYKKKREREKRKEKKLEWSNFEGLYHNNSVCFGLVIKQDDQLSVVYSFSEFSLFFFFFFLVFFI
jgi:hypothetical protein